MLASIVFRLRRFKPVDDFITRMDPYKSAYDWISAGFTLLTSIGVFSWISSNWHYLAEQGWAVVTLFSIACSLAVGIVISFAVTAIAIVRISKRQPVSIAPIDLSKKDVVSKDSRLPSSVESVLALGPEIYVLKSDFESQSSILTDHHDRIMDLARELGTAIGTEQATKENYARDFAELRDDIYTLKTRLDSQFFKLTSVLRARQNRDLIDRSLRNAHEIQNFLDIDKGDEEISWPIWRRRFVEWKGIVRYVKVTGYAYYENDDDILSVTVDQVNGSEWTKDFSNFGGEKNVLEWKQYSIMLRNFEAYVESLQHPLGQATII